MNLNTPLRVYKKPFAVVLALAGAVPRPVEIFLAEHRANEFRPQHVLDLLEQAQTFLPARDATTGRRESFNKDALLWIAVPLAPFGVETAAGEDELFEFRRPARVDLIAGEPIEGELLYSAPVEGTRLVDHLNASGRFLRIWERERLYLINKAFVRRVFELAEKP